MLARLLLTAALLGFLPSIASAQIEQVWMTHRSNDPSSLVVNWTSKQPGPSVVRYGTTEQYEHEVEVVAYVGKASATLHHVEIPLDEQDTTYHYSVQTGDQVSPDATFKSYPTDELRVAVAADWQRQPDLSALMEDEPHLLLTAGDNISSIHELCGAGNKDCIQPYAELIDHYPELFRSTPFMPALGNHDKQIRPRGDEPPEKPVYDIDATAFRRFFELPDDEWKWQFEIPEFDIRFVALDLNHINDMGTTWQACHPFDRESEQFQWYQEIMNENDRHFTVTLYNERNANIRRQEDGAWGEMISKGTLAITGFGYFAERAEVDGFSYYNTSLSTGNRYPDPESEFLAVKPSYVLLTITKEPLEMAVEIKDLDGEVLDRKMFR